VLSLLYDGEIKMCINGVLRDDRATSTRLIIACSTLHWRHSTQIGLSTVVSLYV